LEPENYFLERKGFLRSRKLWRLIQPFDSDFCGKDLKLAQLSCSLDIQKLETSSCPLWNSLIKFQLKHIQPIRSYSRLKLATVPELATEQVLALCLTIFVCT